MVNELQEPPGPVAQRLTAADAAGPAVLVRETTTLREVARLMLQRGVDHVVVVDADGVVRGVVVDHHLTLSSRHLRLSAFKVPRRNVYWVTALEEAEAACVAAETMTAGEIMESCLTTAEVCEPIGSAVDRMSRQDADYALVTRNGDVVGVLGRRDLLRLVAGQWEAAPQSAAMDVSLQQPAAHLAAHLRWPVPGWLARVWR